jgi:hypothetical protein
VQELGRWSSVISSLRGLDSAVLFLENVDAGRGAAMLDGDQAGTKALHSCWACVGQGARGGYDATLGRPRNEQSSFTTHAPLGASAGPSNCRSATPASSRRHRRLAGRMMAHVHGDHQAGRACQERRDSGLDVQGFGAVRGQWSARSQS